MALYRSMSLKESLMTVVPSRYLNNSAFSAIFQTQYINLTTFRKSGAPVPTPVWFAAHENTLYIETGAESGKVKRIRRNPRVMLAPCTASGKITGATVEGRARVISDVGETYIARGALHRKYGLQRQLFYTVSTIIGYLRPQAHEEHGYLAIELVEP
jgi:PPOX class probable F420-dependent enzyme